MKAGCAISRLVVMACVLVLLLSNKGVQTVKAQSGSCPPQESNDYGWAQGSTVTYSLQGLPADAQSQVRAALQSASGSGNPLGVNFAENNVNPSWTFQTGVATVSGTNRPAATSHSVNSTTHIEQSAVTTIDYYNQGGSFFNSSQAGYSNVFTKEALHEAGHTLGLNDVFNNTSLPCGGQVAGNSVMNVFCGVNDAAGNMAAAFTTCDKSSMAANPQLTGGSGSCIRQTCPSGYVWSLDQCACVVRTCSVGCNDGGGGSPILIDLDGSQFPLTSVQNGVWFDLDGDGQVEKTAWTAPDSSVGFLVLDRNGNGQIDDGKELFGNHTPQSASAHPNGFSALAEYDKPENGGNADGVIDPRDAIFQSLRLWIDSNHDGVSETGELHRLSEFGITSISLHYGFSYRRDQYGNQFRFRSQVQSENAGVSHWAYDVFFVTNDDDEAAAVGAHDLDALWELRWRQGGN